MRSYNLYYTEEEGGEWKEWPEDCKCPIIDIENNNIALTELDNIPSQVHSIAWTIRWDKYNGFTKGVDIREKQQVPESTTEVPYATTRDFPARRS